MKYSQENISDNDLDQLFRDAYAAEGVEPLFVPEFWNEMEALLPLDSKKRLVPWYVYAASFVVVALLFSIPFSKPSISEIAQTQTEETAVRNLAQQSETTIPTIETQQASNDISWKNADFNQANTQKRVKLGANPEHVFAQKSPMLEATQTEKATQSDTELEELTFSLPEAEWLVLLPKSWDLCRGKIHELNPLEKQRINWYLELGFTLGQSPYLSQNAKRNLVGGAVLGGGISKRIDQVSVNFGLQARIEGFGGLNYQENNFANDMTRIVSVKQLYSLDFPLRFNYHVKRSSFGFAVIPGIQLFIQGREQIFQNQQITREGNYLGKVEHSSTLSMEMGFNYDYQLTPKYSLGLRLNADVLRPLHTDYYLGKSASIPLNGQVILRRTF